MQTFMAPILQLAGPDLSTLGIGSSLGPLSGHQTFQVIAWLARKKYKKWTWEWGSHLSTWLEVLSAVTGCPREILALASWPPKHPGLNNLKHCIWEEFLGGGKRILGENKLIKYFQDFPENTVNDHRVIHSGLKYTLLFPFTANESY